MCQWCGPPQLAADDFGLTERPAQRLLGKFWEGTHAEAAAGATRALVSEVQAFATGLGDAWIGPIVTLSWDDRPGGFRYFAGVDTSAAAKDMAAFDSPLLRFATSCHDEKKGEVPDHYERMLWWMSANGHRWDKQHLHHREEYPLHADFSEPPILRLMLPVGS